MARCWCFIVVNLVLVMSYVQGQNVTFQYGDTTNVGNISVSEGESLMVCVEKPNVQVRVTAIVKGLPPDPPDLPAALGGLDYSPKQLELEFEASTEQEIKCGQFMIIQDDLDEVKETFILSLSMGNGEEHQKRVNVSITACTDGDIQLRTYTPEPQYYAVEYCHRSENWITLCDETWTEDDAEVVCRQAGRLGDRAIGYRTGIAIYNERQTFPICIGNETRIDECQTDTNLTSGPECLPVLVDCGSRDGRRGKGGTNIAAAVSVPIVIIVFGVCVAVTIAVIYLWKRGLLKWENFRPSERFRNATNSGVHAGNSTSSGQNSSTFHLESAEYTAPFTGPPFSNPSKPPVVMSPHGKKPLIFEKDHYEGCDMATLTGSTKPAPKRQRSNPGVAPKPVKPAKSNSVVEDYSHLQHH